MGYFSGQKSAQNELFAVFGLFFGFGGRKKSAWGSVSTQMGDLRVFEGVILLFYTSGCVLNQEKE